MDFPIDKGLINGMEKLKAEKGHQLRNLMNEIRGPVHIINEAVSIKDDVGSKLIDITKELISVLTINIEVVNIFNFFCFIRSFFSQFNIDKTKLTKNVFQEVFLSLKINC